MIMKPIKYDIKYINDSEWMRINYKSINDSSDGYYIMKRSVYEENKKKFAKLLKDCLIEIIFKYPVTMEDIIRSAIRSLKYQFYIYEYKLKKEQTCTYMDDDLVDEYTTKLTKIHSKLVRLERKLEI